jgi:DNA-binding CsgD family transcriptional regulator
LPCIGIGGGAVWDGVPHAVGIGWERTSELGLLERSSFAAVLGECLADVVGGRGRLVFLVGEAGVGKTALAERFCATSAGGARVLWGGCDGLHTPRPLGPVADIAIATGGSLAAVIERGDKPALVFAALVEELRSRRPTIVVFEDLHWADEATLDVVALLGRRVESLNALVIATFRDDELEGAHPLRVVVGDVCTVAGVRRLDLPPLSLEAVAELALGHGVDGVELFRKTAGNPFFVTEVLSAGAVEMPATIRDAVLARAGRLGASARGVLEAVAVVSPRIEIGLLEALATRELGALDECLASGVLRAEGRAVAFRHELARRVIEDSIPPHRLLVLHREVMRALRIPANGSRDLARLAHHAEAAGEAEAVLEFAPAAAEQAASLGAHREAAAQYERALRFADGCPPELLAGLFERRAFECYLTHQLDEGLEAQRSALACYGQIGDRAREGDALRLLSRLLECTGRTEESEQAGREAVALLEQLPPGRELAMAYANLSQLCLNRDDAEGTLAWGMPAVEIAERLHDAEVLLFALANIGAAEFLTGASEGIAKLERSLELALEHGFEEHACRAYVLLAWLAMRQRSYAVLDRYVRAGLEYCGERDLVLWRLHLLAYRARSDVDQGRWAEALDSAGLVLRDPYCSEGPRVLALAVLGLVRARRGDPDYLPPLEEALALAEPSGELFRIGPVAAARAEAAWLESDHTAIVEATEPAFGLALRSRAPWPIGELACWRWRAGVREDTPAGAAEPYAVQMKGEWARAAELWAQIGCPYEAALALADADDEDALRRALAELQRLEARPAAALVARRLRERGALGLPRGPRRSTRHNPAGLTDRELDVLALITEGLHNAQIAERLFLSTKTVDHHVSSILRKLAVPSRGQAGVEAVRLGLCTQDR